MKKLLITIITILMLIPTNIKANNIDDIINNMTIKQKITQMMMVNFRKWNNQDLTTMNNEIKQIVEDYDFGSIIYFANNMKETKQIYQLTKEFQEAATKDNGIPLLIATDQEGGLVYRLNTGTALPGNMALAATNDTNNSKIAGEIIGSELSSLGINTTLAPVVDINNNANNPVIGLRSFSDDALTVANNARSMLEGLEEYNVIGCAKHFPGHGDTDTDSHTGLPIVNKNKEQILANELKPYDELIKDNIEMIMSAHILYPQLDNTKVLSNKTGKKESLPATMSKKILTDLLKEEMNYSGVIVTDAMNMKGITNKWDNVQAITLAINAGADIICMPVELTCKQDITKLDNIINSLEKAINNKEISINRINDALKRILTLKDIKGILDYNPSSYNLEKALNTVGGKENREKERQISAKAVTVIKNENNILPLNINTNSKLLVLCPDNNEESEILLGWQRAKEANIIEAGAQIKVSTFNKNTNINNENIQWADTIIVNSKISSASINKTWLSTIPNQICNYGKENNKKVIIMSVDKPYDVQLYDNADAIVAVYGCKGSNIDPTEALVGKTNNETFGPNIIAGIEVILGTYGASGKLPIDIPYYNKETNKYTNKIVYKRGTGITYSSKIVNKDELKKKIKELELIEQDNYTDKSYNNFKEQLSKAIVVYNDKTVTQEDVDNALSSLDKAYQHLEEKSYLLIIISLLIIIILILIILVYLKKHKHHYKHRK